MAVSKEAVGLSSFIEGVKQPDITPSGAWQLINELSAKRYPGKEPPPHISHIAQVTLVTETWLPGIDSALLKAISHDAGRAFTQNDAHVILGARILQHFHFPDEIVRFAIAHHNFGLPYRTLTPAKIDSLAVLVADVSKRVIPGTNHETEIVPFDHSLAASLIGPRPSRLSQEGVQFIMSSIKTVEQETGRSYTESIRRAQEAWPDRKKDVVAYWKQIAYDTNHEHQKR